MIPVDQTIVTGTEGDCVRATVATLLNLPIDAVPHFIRFTDDQWWGVYCAFMWALGWEVLGAESKGTPDPALSLNGYFDASVPSRTFPGKSHAVVIDCDGVVVHDPNPNKLWLGVNVIESGDLREWYHVRKREVQL